MEALLPNPSTFEIGEKRFYELYPNVTWEHVDRTFGTVDDGQLIIKKLDHQNNCVYHRKCRRQTYRCSRPDECPVKTLPKEVCAMSLAHELGVGPPIHAVHRVAGMTWYVVQKRAGMDLCELFETYPDHAQFSSLPFKMDLIETAAAQFDRLVCAGKLIHSDIKKDNIIIDLTQTAKDGTVRVDKKSLRVIDFGSCRMYETADAIRDDENAVSDSVTVCYYPEDVVLGKRHNPNTSDKFAFVAFALMVLKRQTGCSQELLERRLTTKKYTSIIRSVVRGLPDETNVKLLTDFFTDVLVSRREKLEAYEYGDIALKILGYLTDRPERKRRLKRRHGDADDDDDSGMNSDDDDDEEEPTIKFASGKPRCMRYGDSSGDEQ